MSDSSPKLLNAKDHVTWQGLPIAVSQVIESIQVVPYRYVISTVFDHSNQQWCRSSPCTCRVMPLGKIAIL
jgi:hypothetical protein